MNIFYVAGIPYSDELYHHGIKGQKWGVRRFQNYDGTRTDAGKKRYSRSSDPKEIASWVHEVSGSARVRSSSKEKLFQAIGPGLELAKNACRGQAKKEAKAFLNYTKAGEKVNDEWDGNKKLREQFASQISKKTIRQIENEAGDKYTGVDGRTTADEFARDYAFNKYSNSDHPLVAKEKELHSKWMVERDALMKSCKDYSDEFFKEHGEDSAVSSNGSIKTVSDVFSEYMSTQLAKEETDKLWQKHNKR